MELIHLVLLGIVQGLTEFLPISSVAHLILLPFLAGWEDQGLMYDIAAHAGSLAAIIFYLRKDLGRIIFSGISYLSHRQANSDSLLFWYLGIATIPIGIVAYCFYSVVATLLRDPLIIAIATIIFGLLLGWADRSCNRTRDLDKLKLKDAIIIGLAQVLALVPGTSRSGITMTAGLMLGFDRTTASRFSFLLAIPTISLATGYECYRYLAMGEGADPFSFFIVFLTSAASAWLAVYLFLGFIEKTGMLPYVIYRLLLGLVLLVVFI